MYNNKKEIKITATIEYEYDLNKIKEIIKELIDLKGLKELEIEDK